MPHDVNGKLLQLNDRVYLPCIVKGLQAGDEYCNCTLESVYPMYPGNSKTAVTVNTKQVAKQGE